MSSSDGIERHVLEGVIDAAIRKAFNQNQRALRNTIAIGVAMGVAAVSVPAGAFVLLVRLLAYVS